MSESLYPKDIGTNKIYKFFCINLFIGTRDVEVEGISIELIHIRIIKNFPSRWTKKKKKEKFMSDPGLDNGSDQELRTEVD